MDWLLTLSSIDQRLFLTLSSYSQRLALQNPAQLISRTGDGYLQVILPIVLSQVLPSEQRMNFLTVVAIAFAIERGAYKVLKNSLRRRRPPQFFPSFECAPSAPVGLNWLID